MFRFRFSGFPSCTPLSARTNTVPHGAHFSKDGSLHSALLMGYMSVSGCLNLLILRQQLNGLRGKIVRFEEARCKSALALVIESNRARTPGGHI